MLLSGGANGVAMALDNLGETVLLVCKFCGHDFLFVSRTREWTIIYCPGCGTDTKEKRDSPKPVFNEILKKQAQNLKRKK